MGGGGVAGRRTGPYIYHHDIVELICGYIKMEDKLAESHLKGL